MKSALCHSSLCGDPDGPPPGSHGSTLSASPYCPLLVAALGSLRTQELRTLLSSMTVLRDSIHIGSMSPSSMIHLGPS